MKNKIVFIICAAIVALGFVSILLGLTGCTIGTSTKMGLTTNVVFFGKSAPATTNITTTTTVVTSTNGIPVSTNTVTTATITPATFTGFKLVLPINVGGAAQTLFAGEGL